MIYESIEQVVNKIFYVPANIETKGKRYILHKHPIYNHYVAHRIENNGSKTSITSYTQNDILRTFNRGKWKLLVNDIEDD